MIISLSDSFRFCLNQINLEEYYNACTADYQHLIHTGELAQAQQALCSAFEITASTCSAVLTNSIEWRRDNRCPKTCPNNMVYTECASFCQKTCENHYLLNIDSDSCKQGCSPGCVCQTGFLRDTNHNNTCVLQESCTCAFRGNQYKSGDSVTVDCNSCQCIGGRWSCTEYKCPRTCSIIGQGHYHTFDGKDFDFISDCEYILVETTPDANLTVPRLSVSRRSHFTEEERLNPTGIPTLLISVAIDESVLTMEEVRANLDNSVQVKLNGVNLQAPTINEKFSLTSSIHFTTVKGKGFEINFDGAKLYITLHAIYQDKTRGLCGTYNFNGGDDFTSPNGFIEVDLTSFTDSYKSDLSSTDCVPPVQTDPCEVDISTASSAQRRCALLKDSEVFEQCRSVLDVTHFVESCQKDLCRDKSKMYQDFYFCNLVQAYVFECANRGISVDWRNSSTMGDLRNACNR